MTAKRQYARPTLRRREALPTITADTMVISAMRIG
jgi:hypothetical protein